MGLSANSERAGDERAGVAGVFGGDCSRLLPKRAVFSGVNTDGAVIVAGLLGDCRFGSRTAPALRGDSNPAFDDCIFSS